MNFLLIQAVPSYLNQFSSMLSNSMIGSINTDRSHINQSFTEYIRVEGTNRSEFRKIEKEKYQEEGRIDVRPFLDPSDGGTLEQKTNNQILNIVAIIIIATIIVITLLLNMFGPVLKMLLQESLSKLRRIKPGVNQRTSLHSSWGMEANLLPNPDSDCNPNASPQGIEESDLYSIDNPESKGIPDNLVSDKKEKKEEYEKE